MKNENYCATCRSYDHFECLGNLKKASKPEHPIGNLEDSLWWPKEPKDGPDPDWYRDSIEIMKRRIEKLELEMIQQKNKPGCSCICKPEQ